MNCCQLKIATFIHAPEGTQESFRVLVSLTVCGENLRQVFSWVKHFNAPRVSMKRFTRWRSAVFNFFKMCLFLKVNFHNILSKCAIFSSAPSTRVSFSSVLSRFWQDGKSRGTGVRVAGASSPKHTGSRSLHSTLVRCCTKKWKNGFSLSGWTRSCLFVVFHFSFHLSTSEPLGWEENPIRRKSWSINHRDKEVGGARDL